MFLITLGFLFFASNGFPVADAFYEKTETLIIDNNNDN